jgi:membrane protein
MLPTPSYWSESRAWRSQRRPKWAVTVLRVLDTVWRGIVSDRLWIRAGNMTYLSLLHLVPLGALALALSSRFGWEGVLVNWIEQRLSPTAPELAANLVGAMHRLDIVAIGYVGLGAMVIAGVIALTELEDELSHMWNARASRQWWQRVLLYPLTVVVGPTVLAVVLAFGTMAEARTKMWITGLQNLGAIGRSLYVLLTDLPLIFEIIPYVLTWMLLTTLYYLVTSAPVRFRSALVGGLSAGIVWQMAQRVYINFQFGSLTYREIWGYMAQIPLLLIWLFVTWVIFFLGAELVFAYQHRHAFMPKWQPGSRIPPGIESWLVAAIARAAVEAGERGISAAELSMANRVPWQLVEQIARDLTDAGFLGERRTSAGYILRAGPFLAQTTVAELLESCRTIRGGFPDTNQYPQYDPKATIQQLAEQGNKEDES